MPKIEDYTIIRSKLGGMMIKDGISIEVCIFRGDAERTWMLEVVEEEGASIVWDVTFASEQAAMDELNRTIAKEGMRRFLSSNGKNEH